jgi:hypothetical protein
MHSNGERKFIMKNPDSVQLLERLMSLCQEVFAARHYEAAYHLLTAAIHVGQDLEDQQALLRIERLAIEQAAWINANAPESMMSSQSAQSRSGVDLYANVIRQAAAHARIIRENRRREDAAFNDALSD